jgi:DNA-binding beta-propeller fold protein YncE
MRRFIWLIACGAFSVFGVLGQAPSMAGPRVGIVVDPASGDIRTVEGILGGASIGPAVAAGQSISGRAVSPRGDYVLAVEAEDLSLWAVQPAQTGSGAAAPIAGAMRGPDAIAISPAGSHAVLYRKDSALLQVLSGLPSAPAVDRNIDLSALSGSLTALAVSEDGAAVLVAASGADGGFVYRIAGQGIAAPILAASQVSALAFSIKGDAAAADTGNNTLWLIANVVGAAGATPLAGFADGVEAPAGVAFSEDGSTAYVANAKSNTVLVLDVAGGPPRASWQCSCVLTTLQAVGNGAFRLTDSLGEALWFLDTARAEPLLVFVPPPQPEPPRKRAPTRGGRIDR